MRRFRIAGFKARIKGPAIFAAALAVGLPAAPLTSCGQQLAKVYTIGYLGNVAPHPAERTARFCPTKGNPSWQAMLEGLGEHGYLQGQNLIIHCRYTEGQPERAPALAAELVRLRVDLIVAFTSPNVRAAKQATSTNPIVMVGVIDPVGRGLVASLARPGGNLTGLAADAGTQIIGKNVELLKAIAPAVTRVAVLGDMFNSTDRLFITELEEAARTLGVTLQSHPVEEPEKLDDTFATIIKKRAEAILVPPSPFNFTHAKRIVDLAAQSRLPGIYPGREHVEAGGLMSFGEYNPAAMFRRIGVYADKIFKGARPGDLPVERPIKFELVINLKTAKALGLTIPQSLLLQADEVIQ